MPHLVIEYSSTLHSIMQFEDVTAIAHQTMIDSGLFAASDIKTRSYMADDFLVGEKGRGGCFAHATISLLEGRTTAQKQALSEAVRDVLSAHLIDVDQLSVEVRDMSKETYRKFSDR